ncbi:MAG: tetratricopeptide repeat protein [Pseudomonadota bacterium]
MSKDLRGFMGLGGSRTFLIAAPILTGVVSATVMAADYVGSAVCGTCHEAEHGAWQGSHHDWALLPATDDTVLGDFEDAVLEHFGNSTRFYRRDGGFFVETDGPDGEPIEVEVLYVVGVAPLQQYLVELEGGRLQSLLTAWDTRPGGEGGQRWFHLQPDEPVGHDDPLHWTGLFYNWNSSCAACHSTGLEKGYDLAADRFATTWAEINVGCEACHGQGSAHVEAMRGESPPGDGGLPVSFHGQHDGAWTFGEDAPIAHWDGPPRQRAELEVCSPCHARRRPISSAHDPADRFLEGYAPAFLEEPLYHADGQILDEVYVYGSFLQSRMYQAGVTCSDCHEPHSLELKASGNEVCGQCHRADVFDVAAHHHHEPGSAGAECAACHMPSQTYMVVDPRRDHSFRVPRPDMSVETGAPNACAQCHDDRPDSWAADAVDAWYGATRRGEPHYGLALQAGRERLPEAGERLAAVVVDPDQPGMARASAMLLLPDNLGPEALGAYEHALTDSDPLVRTAVLRALAPFSPEQRWAVAGDLLEDPLRAVRIEAANVLAVPAGSLSPERQARLDHAVAELIDAYLSQAERPESHLNLGNLYGQLARWSDAEAAYRQALRLDTSFVPAMINLADLQSGRGREDEAEATLRQAIATDAGSATAYHALGLLLVRRAKLDEAVDSLGAAARLDPANPRYGYVYGVALNSVGEGARAIDVLEQVHDQHPSDRDVLLALITMSRDRGALDQARRYARVFATTHPTDPIARQLLTELGL